jgi:hypothetical protein
VQTTSLPGVRIPVSPSDSVKLTRSGMGPGLGASWVGLQIRSVDTLWVASPVDWGLATHKAQSEGGLGKTFIIHLDSWNLPWRMPRGKLEARR